MSFAVHLLTGWAPLILDSLSASTTGEVARRMVGQGVPFIEPHSVPPMEQIDTNEPDQERSRIERKVLLGSFDLYILVNLLLQTKAVLQKEYHERAERRNVILGLIAARESKILALDRELTGAISKCFMVNTGLEMLPVLATSFAGDASSVLVEWTAEVWRSPESHEGTLEAYQNFGIDDSLSMEFCAPRQSKVESKWVDLNFVAEHEGCIITWDCLTEYTECARLSCHWNPVVHEPSTLGKGKDQKAKTNKEKEPSKSVHPLLCEYAPQQPSILAVNIGGSKPNNIPLLIILQADVTQSENEKLQKATVVLEELRFDTYEPISFRIDIDTSAALPLVSKIIEIPISPRLPFDDNLLLHLRFLSPVSLSVSFRSRFPLKVGDIGSIWSTLGQEYTRLDGEVLPTKAYTEQLLFRAMFSTTAENEVDSFHEEPIVVVLHTSDRNLTSRVSILIADESGLDGQSLASLENSVVSAKQVPQLLMARCLPSPNDLPSFKWTLFLMSKQRLQFKSWLPEKPPQRYSGRYVPNNKMRLFRDVISIEKTSQPAALRLSASISNYETEGKSCTDNFYGCVALKLKIYGKGGENLLCELRGNGAISLFWLPVELLSTDDTGASSSPNEKMREKNKTRKPPAPEVLEFLLECSIDEDAMIIPNVWRSAAPPVFDLSISENVEQTFTWNLDLLAGKVHRVGYDTTDIARFSALKNEWEQKDPSRSDRAQAALAYFTNAHNIGAAEKKVERLSLLSQALSKDAAELGAYEEALAEADHSVSYEIY